MLRELERLDFSGKGEEFVESKFLTPPFRRGILALATLFSLATGGARAGSPPYATKVYIGRDIEVSLYSPTMFRFRISEVEPEHFPAKYEIPFVMGRLAPWPEVPYRRWSEGKFEWIETSALRMRVDKACQAWTVWSVDGAQRIYPSDGPMRGMFRDGYTVFDAASAFGERNANSRYAHWFYNSQTGRYVDTYLADDLILDEFFIYGPGYDRLFQELNDLVGPEPLLPKKAYGFFQSQNIGCTGSQTTLLSLAKKLRDHDIPVDTLIVDYEWGDGCPSADPRNLLLGRLDWASSYAAPLSPREMLAQLHALHFDVMLIHHSAPKFAHRSGDETWQVPKVYDEDLWWDKIRGELSMGVDGLWQDTRQHDITDSVIWKGLQDYWGTSRRALFMGNRDVWEMNSWWPDVDRRGSNLSLLGSRRYPFRWTGDAGTRWSELRFQIDAITNSQGSLKGVSYLTADGWGKNWQHQARWNQFLSFSPVARSHSMKPWEAHLDLLTLEKIANFHLDRFVDDAQLMTEPDQQVVTEWVENNAPNIKTAENSVRQHLKLRYRLLPYIYSLAYIHYLTGMPIARPMDLAFPADPVCAQNRWPYQYMFGDAFLVAPVYADLHSMEIYLPRGNEWIDYWNHQVYAGGQILDYDTSDAEKLPLFVRAGSIIPMRAEANWIDSRVPDNPLYVDVYPSRQPGTFTLYEDDGETTEYQSGRFAKIGLQVQREQNGDVSLSVGESQGDYNGRPASRSIEFTVQFGDKAPGSVTRNGAGLPSLKTPEARRQSLEGWRYDPKGHAVIVKVNQPSVSPSKIVISSEGLPSVMRRGSEIR